MFIFKKVKKLFMVCLASSFCFCYFSHIKAIKYKDIKVPINFKGEEDFVKNYEIFSLDELRQTKLILKCVRSKISDFKFGVVDGSEKIKDKEKINQLYLVSTKMYNIILELIELVKKINIQTHTDTIEKFRSYKRATMSEKSFFIYKNRVIGKNDFFIELGKEVMIEKIDVLINYFRTSNNIKYIFENNKDLCDFDQYKQLDYFINNKCDYSEILFNCHKYIQAAQISIDNLCFLIQKNSFNINSCV